MTGRNWLFTDELKAEAVRLSRECGRTVDQITKWQMGFGTPYWHRKIDADVVATTTARR